MKEKLKQNIYYCIVASILLWTGWLLGYIAGKAEGEYKTMDRYNKLLEDYEYYSAERDH